MISRFTTILKATLKLPGFLFFLCALITSCSQPKQAVQQENSHAFTNQLINETSPYLLQHAHNPVNWYPWGEEALQKAKKENKPIIISIGYAACHWCHVMEKESFTDAAVAKVMNEQFVCIKVDREQRPDIDQIYIEAAELINGNAGWPLNCIALPDARPFFAGTYYTKKEWLNLLQEYSDLYRRNPARLQKDAENITRGIQAVDSRAFKTANEFNKQELNDIYTSWAGFFDSKEGGYGRSPKFPLPGSLQTLLNYYYFSQDEALLQQIELTLDKMASGGMYDHIGGGFARYSTDRGWKVPHFEKMLYDNAQMVSLYAKAYQLTRKESYKEVVYQTLAFVERELMAKEGGFYSSLDADSEGEEGKFYVWTKKELEAALGAGAKPFMAVYSIEQQGNWDGNKNIVYQKKTLAESAQALSITENELKNSLKQSKQTLLAAREKRSRPGLDDKILTSWNSLMIKAYTDAYRVFGEEAFLQKAIQGGEFLVKNMVQKDNRLNRDFKNNISTVNAFLDDYSFTIDAFIALYQATFDERWLHKANDLLNYALTHFYDGQSGLFFYTSDTDPGLIIRKKEVADNVIPSSNSAMARNLLYLGSYYFKEAYLNKSRKMLSAVVADAKVSPLRYYNWIDLYIHAVYPLYEIAIVGEKADSIRKEMDAYFLPNTLLLGGKTEGTLELLQSKLVDNQTTIYICYQRACKKPVLQVSQALEQMR